MKKQIEFADAFWFLNKFIFCIIHTISHQVSLFLGSYNDSMKHKMFIPLKIDWCS